MATLNTLRTRGGVIVSIVIGIALLAFLLGDLTSSGGGLMNARKMRVGEINGSNVDYVEYSESVDYLTQIEQSMSGKEALTVEDQERVKNQAWDLMLNKYSIEPGFEELGIDVSEAEQVDMVDGGYISPVISSIFVNPSSGMFDIALLRNFVANIAQDPTGKMANIWNYLKGQMNKERLMSKYMSLVSKGVYVNDLEVEQGVALSNSLAAISFIDQPYTLIADSTVVVSESEVKKYYNDHQPLFRQNPYRDIEYVVFDVLPSPEDQSAAVTYFDELAAEFAQSDAPLQYAVLNSQVQPNKRYLSEKEMTGPLAAFAFGANSSAMYGPLQNGTTLTMARVADTKMLPDSIGARHILLSAEQAASADSILTALKGGASFADLAAQYSIDQQANQRGGDLGVFNPDQMVPEFSAAALAVNQGNYFTVATQFGTHIGQLTYRSAPVKKVQVAEITYKVEPSEQTQQTSYGAASKFIADAAGKYEGFKKSATDNVLSKRVARVYGADRGIQGFQNSREMVRWAFTNEKDAVSSIIEVDGNYVVMALAEVAEEPIAPLSSISKDIASLLRQDKKGAMLAEKLAGSSLPEVASKLGVEVKQVTDIDFNSFYVQNVGVEPALIGAVTAVAPSALSKPVMGNEAVYLFQVDSRMAVAEPVTTESERVRLVAAAEGYLMERVSQALVQNSKVKDNRVKFF